MSEKKLSVRRVGTRVSVHWRRQRLYVWDTSHAKRLSMLMAGARSVCVESRDGSGARRCARARRPLLPSVAGVKGKGGDDSVPASSCDPLAGPCSSPGAQPHRRFTDRKRRRTEGDGTIASSWRRKARLRMIRWCQIHARRTRGAQAHTPPLAQPGDDFANRFIPSS